MKYKDKTAEYKLRLDSWGWLCYSYCNTPCKEYKATTFFNIDLKNLVKQWKSERNDFNYPFGVVPFGCKIEFNM